MNQTKRISEVRGDKSSFIRVENYAQLKMQQARQLTAKKAFLMLFILLSLNITIANAEEIADSGTAPPRTVENKDYYQLEKELQNQKTGEEKSNVVDNTPKQEVVTPDSSITFVVTKIETDPSAILAADEIVAITSKYEGRTVSIKELYQALQDFNDLYAKKGFITAKAVLPPQKITGGIVHIKLVEGHFGQILLEGNKSTRSSYILARLSEHSGGLVNIHALEQDIFYFNKINDIQLKAELKPGKEFGLTDCVIKVEEPPRIQTTLFSDDEGAVNTGQYRYGINLTDNSLTGNRDSLVLSPLWAQGTWAGSLSYNRPLNKVGTTLGLNYSKNQSTVISGPFEGLDISSNETDISLSLSRPLIVKPNSKCDGYLTVYNKKAETDFSGNALIDYHVNTVSLGVTFQDVVKNGFCYHRYDITRGVSDICDQFYRFNLSLVRQQKFNDRLLIYRIAGQVTNGHLLPSTEEFSIGGMATARGFSAGLYSGDQGYDLSIEYDFPLRFSNKVQGVLFIDHGGVFPYKGNGDPSGDFLTGAGFGINLNLSKYLSGKLIFGFPVNPPLGGVRVEYYFQSVLF